MLKAVPLVTTKSESFKSAFRVDPDALRRLVGLLDNEVLRQIELSKYRERVIEYVVELSDGSNLSTTDLEEVLNLENARRRHITAVSLATPYADSIRATVKLSNDSPPITYNLRGDDKEVVSLSSKLDEHLTGLRQWYSVVARYSLFGLLAALSALVFFAAYVFLLADVVFPNLVTDGGASEADESRIQGTFIAATISVYVLAFLLDRLRTLLFPRATFAVGQGAKRDKTLSGLRVGAITVVAIPVLISAFFWYIGLNST